MGPIDLTHEQQKQVWDDLWNHQVSYQWDVLSESILLSLLKHIGIAQDQCSLEAGSGTGKISLRLAQLGAHVTLVDYSTKALCNSRHAFERSHQRGAFVEADIRTMPIETGSIDFTWNAGVLEHFTEPERLLILQEMKRVTRPGGWVISFVPNAQCLPYRIGKAYAEAFGSWRYGTETPIESLRHEFIQSGLFVVDEYDIAFSTGLDFLDFIPQTRPLKTWMSEWYGTLPDPDRRKFQGYLIATIGHVPE